MAKEEFFSLDLPLLVPSSGEAGGTLFLSDLADLNICFLLKCLLIVRIFFRLNILEQMQK